MSDSDDKVRALIHAFEQLKMATLAGVDNNNAAYNAIDGTPQLLVTRTNGEDTHFVAAGSPDQIERLVAIAIEGLVEQEPECGPRLAQFLIELLEGRIKTPQKTQNVFEIKPGKKHLH